MIAALHDSGRDENYDNVAADLADRGRIDRRRRGRYARPERIVITLTQGSLNNSYINLGDHLDFFPADAVGAANRHDREGTMLTLHYDGLPEPVETDIAGAPHKDFRDRASIRKFFAHHDLKSGERITIHKQSDYEYHIVPIR